MPIEHLRLLSQQYYRPKQVAGHTADAFNGCEYNVVSRKL